MSKVPCPLCGSTAGPGHPCPAAVNKLLGKVLDGRYRIETVIGEGGMGCVYRAIQTSIQRPVAVKTLHPSLATSSRFFERFRREAELASKLRHPNVITVFDYGQTEDGTCYYVMELVDGESVRQMVRRKGPISLRRAVSVVEQTARGLAHAHAMGCIHRDLKPHNLMVQQVDGKEFIKVLDFGLVKLLEAEELELTSTGQVLGTPQYMPPEQASGDDVDARADLYSLGAVFFFCLTGASPYGANSVRKALTAILTQPLPTVASKRKGAPVPRSVEEFLRTALARDRKDRHASAEEFIRALSESVAGVEDAVLDAEPHLEGSADRVTPAGAAAKRPITPPDAAPAAAARTTPAPQKRAELAAPATSKDKDKARVTAPERPRRKSSSRSRRRNRMPLMVACALVITASLAYAGMRFWFREHPRHELPPVHVEGVTVKPPLPAPVLPPARLEVTPREVIVRLLSQPEGATVFEGGMQIGRTPAEVRFTRGQHRLRFQLQGREAVARTVDLSRLAQDHTEVSVVLPAPPKATPHRRKEPDDNIPVFE